MYYLAVAEGDVEPDAGADAAQPRAAIRIYTHHVSNGKYSGTSWRTHPIRRANQRSSSGGISSASQSNAWRASKRCEAASSMTAATAAFLSS